ncbi:MAG: DUF2829 domain-containing protein [Methylococcales bacterium]|jgi:hypothetical protein|nr:DUF2829 domain-containing protein [Methylococcales bacterium]MBT7443509.1 DUF2829 domain-containing protein [Methylococcales bacterium]
MLTFTDAIKALKEGEKIARTEWSHDQYLRLVYIAADGEMTAADEYLEMKLGITKQVVSSRIDLYDAAGLQRQNWMASEGDIKAEWQLWVQHH